MIMKSSKKLLKWKCLKTSLVITSILFSSHFTYSQSCAYNSSLDESNKLCTALGKKDFVSNSDADKALNLILSTIGASKRFILRECASINNACATTYKGVRYVFYNDRFMDDIVNMSDNWSNLSILAHEVGHHINGHTLEVLLYTSDVVKEVSLSESRKQELEADEFSGFVMAKLGATKEQALKVMRIISSDEDDTNSTHPSKSKRLAAITRGYNNGKSQSKTTTQTVYKDKVVYKDKIVYQTKTDTIYVTPTKNYEDYFYQGIEEYYNNDLNAAIASFLHSVNDNNRFVPALNNLGLAYNDLKQYDTSISYFTKALNVDSNRIGVIKNRAIAYYNNDQYQEAINDCSLALKYSNDDYELFKIRGGSYFNTNQFDLAIKDFELVLSMNDSDAHTLYQLGVLNGIKGKLKKSIEYLSKAIDQSPNSNYYYNRAISLIKLRDVNSSIKDLEFVVKNDSKNVKALVLLADQYLFVAEFEKACDMYSKAAELGSESAKKKNEENCGAFDALKKTRNL